MCLAMAEKLPNWYVFCMIFAVCLIFIVHGDHLRISKFSKWGEVALFKRAWNLDSSISCLENWSLWKIQFTSCWISNGYPNIVWHVDVLFECNLIFYLLYSYRWLRLEKFARWWSTDIAVFIKDGKIWVQ